LNSNSHSIEEHHHLRIMNMTRNHSSEIHVKERN